MYVQIWGKTKIQILAIGDSVESQKLHASHIAIVLRGKLAIREADLNAELDDTDVKKER